MITFIPQNLDLDKFLTSHPPVFNYHVDVFKYVIGLITEIPSRNKDILNDYDYVPIHTKTLKMVVNNYRRYIDYLLQYGIFETDNKYIMFEKSKGYRFTNAYSVKVKMVEIRKHTLLKKLNQKAVLSRRVQNKKYPYLAKWFNDKLCISSNDAYSFIGEMFAVNLQEDGFQKVVLKQNISYRNVFNLSEHLYQCNVDDTVGRFHNPLTSIKSELRNFISYNGKNLVSIDISNSQPYFSTILFNANFYKSPTRSLPLNSLPGITAGTLIIADINKYKINKSISEELHSYIMWVNNEVSHTGKGFQPYIDSVVEGGLYEVIKEHYERLTGKTIKDRRELKSFMFVLLFTDNKFYSQKGGVWYYDKKKEKLLEQQDAIGKRIFNGLFPEVYKVFSIVKSKGKSALPCLLQSIEAHVMLDVVGKRIGKERPDLPIFTIHDSITTTIGNEDYIASVMYEEMERLIGHRPTLKYEYWTFENAYKSLNEKKNSLNALIQAA